LEDPKSGKATAPQGRQGREQDNTVTEFEPPELVNTMYIYTQCTWATRVTVLCLSVSLLPLSGTTGYNSDTFSFEEMTRALVLKTIKDTMCLLTDFPLMTSILM
jgi:hypothetical protein